MSNFGMLAHHVGPNLENYLGWYASRKLNGWHCLWDGGVTRGMLCREVPWYTNRTGLYNQSTGLWTLGRYSGTKPIYAPNWWLDKLPVNVPITGELWQSSDKVEFIKSVAGKNRVNSLADPRWKDLQFKVVNVKPYSLWTGFDRICEVNRSATSLFYENEPWISIIKKAKDLTISNEIFSFLDQQFIYSKEVLLSVVKNVRVKDYEGFMLIYPKTYYELKRSHNLLKGKKFYETEATVKEYFPGEGVCLGKMGSLGCEIVWDSKIASVFGGSTEFINKKVSFKIGGGFSSDQRNWDFVKEHFPIGGKINFSYLGVTSSGIPNSSNFTGVFK